MVQLQRLLIALSRWIGKIAKQPQIEYNNSPQLNTRGAFVDQTLASLEIYVDEIYNEDEDFMLTIQYACACGYPVFRLHDDYGFACMHCDSICEIKDCKDCKSLFEVDFGDPNANI